jgi:hypothetical protein
MKSIESITANLNRRSDELNVTLPIVKPNEKVASAKAMAKK